MGKIGDFHPGMIAVTPNRFANQYLAAAARLGLETKPLFDERRTWLIKGRGRRLTVRAAILGCNNPLAARFSANKHFTHLLMAGRGIAMPDYRRFFVTGDEAWRAAAAEAIRWSKGRYPVVVKSSTGSGAKNVHVDIENDDELEKMLRTLRAADVSDFLVEAQLFGTMYRVQAFDGAVVGVFAKYPGTVTGDGTASIRELVRAIDRERAAGGQGPVALRGQVVRHLRKHGLKLSSVLSRGVVQTLTAEISGRLGCRRETVPVDALPPGAHALFRRAAAASGLRWVGFDYFCEDITDPRRAHRGAFNEVNSAPTPTEFRPGMGETAYLGVATTVLSRYFGIGRVAEPSG